MSRGRDRMEREKEKDRMERREREGEWRQGAGLGEGKGIESEGWSRERGSRVGVEERDKLFLWRKGRVDSEKGKGREWRNEKEEKRYNGTRRKDKRKEKEKRVE